jgi:hypothetical protein
VGDDEDDDKVQYEEVPQISDDVSQRTSVQCLFLCPSVRRFSHAYRFVMQEEDDGEDIAEVINSIRTQKERELKGGCLVQSGRFSVLVHLFFLCSPNMHISVVLISLRV